MADRRLPLLVMLAGALGALLWWDMASGPEAPEVVDAAGPPSRIAGARSSPAAANAAGTANPLASLDKEALRDITERPLFAPSRRPPPLPAPVAAAPAVAPLPAPPSTPDYTLVGIIRDGDRAIALLRSRSDGRNLRIEAGDIVGGWRIAAVDARSVRLKRADGAAHELRLAPR
jgi:general secretion pathway protein N